MNNNMNQNCNNKIHLGKKASIAIKLGAFFLVWAALFAILQLTNQYHFFFWEQHQLYIPGAEQACFSLKNGLHIATEWLTQWYYYRYAGAVILSLLLAITASCIYLIAKRLKASTPIAAAIALICLCLNALIHFTNQSKLEFQLCLLIIVLLWAIIGRIGSQECFRDLSKARKYVTVLLNAVCAIAIVAAFVIEKPEFSMPDADQELQLAVENEYYFGNYDKVLQLINEAPEKSDIMIFYYNLIHAKRGELPDHLFDMPRQVLGTELVADEESPRPLFRIMPEFYYEIGDMVYAERAAMLCMVFTKHNMFTPMLKRLAEINLVANDTLVANKYLNMLKQAPAYRQWAEEHTPGHMSPQVAQEISQRQQFVNTADTIRLGADSHRILERLLDTNKQNTVALDYLLCTYMLERNRDAFINAYNKYGPRPKPLYNSGLAAE